MAKRGRPRKYFNQKCGSIYTSPNRPEIQKIPYPEFEQWYEHQTKACEYCGLTEGDSERLYHAYPEATRGGKRGRHLELDRRNPYLSYGESIENFVLACYWCNNAKTNYFTAEEFQEIGHVIGLVNQKRLSALPQEKEQ